MNNIECKICRKICIGYSGIASHICQTHKISLKEYYDEYLKTNEDEGKCLRIGCKKRTKFTGLFGGYHEYCSVSCAQKTKQIQACLKIFGVKNPFQSQNIKEKIKQTNLKNCGCENPSQSEKIKERKRQTNLKHRNVDSPFKSPEIRYKCKQTNIKNCGFGFWAQTSQGKLVLRKNCIENIKLRRIYKSEDFCPSIGENEPPCFDFLEGIVNCYIERQPEIGGFFPDGRILHLLLLIEFDEPDHYKNGYSKKDIEREEFLVSQGYIMFRIKQIDWEQSKEKVINDFKILCENLK